MSLKVSEMRDKSVEALKAELLVQRRAQMNMRFQAANLTLSNVSNVKKVRRSIAQLKTLINEKLRVAILLILVLTG